MAEEKVLSLSATINTKEGELTYQKTVEVKPGISRPNQIVTIKRDSLNADQRRVYDAFKDLVISLSNK